MKKFLLAALMAGVASSALAADLPTRKAPPAPAPYYAPPVFSWTGFYVGVNGGWGGGDRAAATSATRAAASSAARSATTTRSASSSSASKATWDWADLTKHGANAARLLQQQGRRIVTARARAGFAIDRALLYVTARLRRRRRQVQRAAGGVSSTDWRNGGVIGGGLEYAFTNNISAKAEYLYAPFGSKTYTSSELAGRATSICRSSAPA